MVTLPTCSRDTPTILASSPSQELELGGVRELFVTMFVNQATSLS